MNSNFTKLASCLSYLFMLAINWPLWAYSPIGKEPVKQIIGKQSHYGGRTNYDFLAKMIPCTEPIITPTSDRKACHNDIGAAINFQANVTNPTFTWIKKSSIAGQATSIAIQGYGNIPSYTATNTTCLILTDSIIVTPYNKLSNIDSCAGIPDTFLLKTIPRAVVNTIRDSSFCNGQTWTPPAFDGTCKDSTVYYWQKRPGPGGTTTPGLALSGKGNLPTFSIVNNPPSCLILTDTIIVTPYYISKGLNDSCSGAIMKFIIKSVPSPTISKTNDTSYCAGSSVAGFNFTTSCTVGSKIKWTKTSVGGPGNSGTSIAGKGTGNIPGFTTTNNGLTILTDTIIANSTFVSVGDSCTGISDTFLIHVLPKSTVAFIRDTTYCHGTKIPRLTFTSLFPGVKFTWTRTGANMGIPTSGVDSIPMFIVNNTTNSVIVNTITVTPNIMMNNVTCPGTSFTFKISAYPQPMARCKSAFINLDAMGNASITTSTVNMGSTGKLLSVIPSTFNCTNVGINMVTLTVVDSCGNTSTCVATVTVADNIPPNLFCFDQVINLQPTTCDTRFRYVPTATDNCGTVDVIAQDTALYGVGKPITAGSHIVCFTATDNNGNTATCCINVQVNTFTNPIGSLTCDDNIQISLDDQCSATISADLFLKGGPYRCFSEYKILVQLWNGGPYIDRNPTKPGVQISSLDIGKILKVTVIDTVSGNSCWGRATVEDKQAPVMTCPVNTIIGCDINSNPSNLGIPLVVENCNNYKLTYVDVVTKGNCAVGVDHWIRRTWIAIDDYNNKSFCVQFITVKYADIDLVEMPLDYNGFITPKGTHALSCDSRIDKNFDFKKHLLPSPNCVDDYLLDNNIYIATGRRVPKLLGWNIIEGGPYAGHPSTESIYYPTHEDSSDCWNSNEVVMWEGTGIPIIYGCSNVGVTFTDLVINTTKPNCKTKDVGCFKLLRTWTLLDWCTSKIRTYQQIIKVEDTEGPEIGYPDSINILISPFVCSAQWEVKDIWFKDNCSIDISYSISTSEGTVIGNSNSGYIVVDIPIGDHYASILAEDCCGNITEKRILLHVIDKTPPTAICQSKTVVSLTGNLSPGQNHTTVNANSFDDGSYDNCATHVHFKVIRMDELNGTFNGSNTVSNVCNNINGDDNLVVAGSQTYFDDNVNFCCADVSLVKMIVFRVFDVDPGVGPVLPTRMNQGGDLFGHFSDCMVEVTIQNKVNPIVIAPADIVISCEYWLDIDRLKNPKDSVLGKMVDDIAWRRKIITNDIVCEAYCKKNLITTYPGYSSLSGTAPNLACDYYYQYYDKNHSTKKYDLLWGFDGYISSPCGINITISVDDQRHCGQGKIIRTFSAMGQNNQIITAKQTIWVVDCDPFYVNSNNDCDTLDDIIWPDCAGLGTYIYSCGANVDANIIGKPKVVNGADDHCALIAIEFTDQLFTGDHDACYIILRKWVVIDWCQYDPNISKSNGRWEHSQFIKVNDREKPIVNCTMGNCEVATLNTQNGVCYGHINLSASAFDSCSPADWLNFEYKIDLFNNGSIDYNVGSLNRKQFVSGEKPAIRNNPSADNNNNPFDASGTYPIGIHNITWYVSDGCGNVGTCSKLFEIKDCKAPTPYCLTGIITVPMPSTGCIDIWAKNLDFGSFDNCTSKDKLKLYFDGIKSKTSIRVCCEDFEKARVNDELRIDVRLYVEDEEGNKDYCSTVIIVQDNQNICKNVGSLLTISGEMKTESGIGTTNTKVDIYNEGLLIDSKITNADGKYVFNDIIPFTNYLIKPLRNDDPLNGVSTADILKIQKHILGKELLNSPFKLIAADVNNSNSITSADISEIRKLILGVIPNFSKVNSWKFVPSSTRFEDITAPWEYKTDFKVNIKDKSEKVDFVSIKMADVNESASANLSKPISARSTQKLEFVINDAKIEVGESYGIDFKVKDLIKIQGFQFTFNFNNNLLLFESLTAGLISMTEANVGINNLNKGKLTISWNADQILTLDPNTTLFTLNFKALGNSRLRNNLIISSDITTAEYYNEFMDNGSIELYLKGSGQITDASIFELIGGAPNPFKEFIDISLRLPESAPVLITIYDAVGKVHRVIQLNGTKGLNIARINKNDLAGSGMYYYQIDAAHNTATGKMVLID